MFKTEEIELNGVPRLAITLDAYPTTPFVVGAVEFNEVDGELRLRYTWESVEDNAPETKAFTDAIGDFIVHYLKNSEKEHPVIYKGGTDGDR